MRAPSSLLLLLAGCDFAFGVNGKPEPCELASFDNATRTEIVEADEFSVDWDQTVAVVQWRGLAAEVRLPDGEPEVIDLGVYTIASLGLTPEGNALFYTATIEPPVIMGALRDDASWKLDAVVPHGAYAGAPSADVFGPRRVFVRLRETDADVQEFADDHGRWKPVGEPMSAPDFLGAPNLTPNGLTMVYDGLDAAAAPVVVARSRASVDEPFGDRVEIFAGHVRRPQLCGQCEQLYAIAPGSGANMLTRFDR